MVAVQHKLQFSYLYWNYNTGRVPTETSYLYRVHSKALIKQALRDRRASDVSSDIAKATEWEEGSIVHIVTVLYQLVLQCLALHTLWLQEYHHILPLTSIYP